MMKNRRDLILSLGLLLAVALACKGGFTTANISSLKIASDEAGNNETKSFKPGDKVYAVAQISNNVGKVHAKFRVLYDDVQGQTAGTLVPGAESDCEALVPREDVALVSIVTPVATHYEMTVAARDAGKAVLCEKPMAMNADQAREMTDKARDANILALIDHELRFLPGRIMLRDLIRRGEIGKV